MDVRVEDLCKSWERHPVLDGVTLSIPAGGIVALVGRSGSGKSTLLHLLAGIDVPDRGRVVLGDADLSTLDEDARAALRRRAVGLVFQDYNLVPSLDAGDNVRLALELAGVRTGEARARSRALLAELGLAALAGRHPEQLSGGEQQRVAIARALAHGPGLLLADEPTGSLDADTAARVLDLLVRACRARGTTLVMATHSQDVMGRADRVLRLERGRLLPAA